MFNKKGQAAMEFLMTYGWAILVVLAAIGALAYFGVLSPDKLVPERTSFSAPFPSSEAAVLDMTDKTVIVALTNNYGQKIEIVQTTASGTGDCLTPSVETTQIAGAAPGGDFNVSNGETFLMKWTCTTFTGSVGDRFETDLTFSYVTPSGLTHTHTGTVNGQVKD